MSKILFGRCKWSAILGYVLAGLIALDEITQSGETSVNRILLAIALAVVGRMVNNGNRTNSKKKRNAKKPIPPADSRPDGGSL